MQILGFRTSVLVVVAALAIAGCPDRAGFDAGDSGTEPADTGTAFDAPRDVPGTDDRAPIDVAADSGLHPDAPVEVARADVPDPFDTGTVVSDAAAEASSDVVADVGPACRPMLGMCAGASDCCSMSCVGARCTCMPFQAPCTFNAACCSGRCNIPTSQCLCGDLGAPCTDDPDCCGRLTCAGSVCSM